VPSYDVRYNWLRYVGYTLPLVFGGGDLIRIVCNDGYSDNRMLLLDTELRRSESGADLANLIAGRAAALWVALGDVPDDKQFDFSNLISNRNPLRPVKRQMAMHRMPQYQ